jgi:hypothetical protein
LEIQNTTVPGRQRRGDAYWRDLAKSADQNITEVVVLQDTLCERRNERSGRDGEGNRAALMM